MYRDFYLKFAAEAEAKSVLFTVTPAQLDAEGVTISEETITPNFRNIDVLGIIYNNDAVIDADGNLVTPATPKVGWHVNVRALEDEDATALDAYAVVPAAPRRIWG